MNASRQILIMKIWWIVVGIIGERNLTFRLHNNHSLELNWSQISTDVSCDGSISDYRLQWRRTNQIYSNVEYIRQSNYYINSKQNCYLKRASDSSNKIVIFLCSFNKILILNWMFVNCIPKLPISRDSIL